MKTHIKLSLVSLFVLGLTSCGNTSQTSLILSSSSSTSYNLHPVQDYKKTLEYKDNFRILWLTDIHYGTPLLTETYDAQAELKHLDKMIVSANNPDLIVLTGDTFEGATAEQFDEFFTFIDSYKIPWAFTYGNHDSESLKDSEFILNQKIMNAKYSVFVDYENDGIDGLCNYYIDLTKDGKAVYRLFLVDSHGVKPEDEIGDSLFDVIHLNQLEHVEEINSFQNDKAPGLLFYHIPLREVAEAWKGYTATPQIYQGQGEKREDYGFGYKNNGAYKTFTNANVIGMFSGHLHRNNYDIDYFDSDNHVVFSSGLKSSNLNYHDDDLIGYKIITLPSDSTSFNHTSITQTKVAY